MACVSVIMRKLYEILFGIMMLPAQDVFFGLTFSREYASSYLRNMFLSTLQAVKDKLNLVARSTGQPSNGMGSLLIR